MSREVLIKTVDKAVRDTRFRSQLLKDPKGTLSGLNLSREEYGAVVQLTNESYNYFQNQLESNVVTSALACLAGSESSTTLSRYNLTDLVKLVDG